MQIGESAHVHLYELTPRVPAGERGRKRVAFDDMPLIEKFPHGSTVPGRREWDPLYRR